MRSNRSMSALAIVLGVIVWRVASEILTERARLRTAGVNTGGDPADQQRAVVSAGVENSLAGPVNTTPVNEHIVAQPVKTIADQVVALPVPTTTEPAISAREGDATSMAAMGADEARRGISVGCAIGSLAASVASAMIPGPDWTWIAGVLPGLALMLGACAVVCASPRAAR